MKYRLFILIAAALAICAGLLVPTKTAQANSVCTGSNVTACVYQYIPYTFDYQCLCDEYGKNCQICQQTAIERRCTIPQVGGGSCSCCFNDGCYLDCPGTNTGGDDNGDDNTPDPTATPLPVPGTITAVARIVTSDDTSCAAVSSSTTPADATFGFTTYPGTEPAPQTQTGNTPVTFADMDVGQYTIDFSVADPNLVLMAPCIYRNGALIAYGQSANLTGGATLEWRFGFMEGAAWAQTQGGDVYASGVLRSLIPSTATQPLFNRIDTSGYPGVVTYGTSYDFDAAWDSTGPTSVSATNWLVNSARPTVDYYDYFYHRFGSPTEVTTDPSFGNLLAVTQPPSSDVPYYVVGDVTTSGDWLIDDDDTVIVVVDGNLTITGNIRLGGTGRGFVAFIVNGDITIDPSVGRAATGTTPNIEGVYITSSTGTFATGESLSATTARFVGKGMFIAGNFLLERDLEGYGSGNTASSAELFIYNPAFLVTMPDPMKEVPVTWREVAP